MARSATLNVMVKAALDAGRSLARDYVDAKNTKFSLKGPSNYVSTADKKSEDIIKKQLLAAKPDYCFLLEESGSIEGNDRQHRFIIDPLDGTTNFLHGIPYFGISIALESQGELQLAVIYDPLRDELFTAEKGKGAFLNDRRIRVNNLKNLEDSVICTGIPHLGRLYHKEFLFELSGIMASCAGVRRTGAAALDLAYLACGRFDGFWEAQLQPWDMAAGMLLIKEAGGFFSTKTGNKDVLSEGSIVAGNEHIHKALIQKIEKAFKLQSQTSK